MPSVLSKPAHKHLLALIVIILGMFVYGARWWGVDGNTDAVAADIAAWKLVETGSLDLTGRESIESNLDGLERWFVMTPHGAIVSNRAPGIIFLAVPAYWVFSASEFTVAPGTLVAVLATLAAVLVTWRVLIPLIGLNGATASALVLAFGTTTWRISSSELWPHGPGQLWAALAILSLSTSSYWGTGFALAASILTRPLTGVFAAVIGLLEAIRLRSIRLLIRIGIASSFGLVALVVYNARVFGQLSLRGGYSSVYTTGLPERLDSNEYLHNAWEMFFGLPNGVLLTSPVLGVAILGAVWARKTIPGWAKSSALAGVAYLLVHAALNRASGGMAAFYRYPLEAIVLASPALAIGARNLWLKAGVWERVVGISAIVSVVAQFLNVFVLLCYSSVPVVHSCILQ